jgi:hypothetical protein
MRNSNGIVIAKDNLPGQGYCMEVSSSFFTRKVAVAKYSAPAITGLDSEAFVEAKCIELP